MAVSMKLRWRNPDASMDINTRFKDVFTKGFTVTDLGLVEGSGDQLLVPVAGNLEIDVSPFILVNEDGAVVLNDATERLTIVDGDVNYVVCRARYRSFDTPILSLEVLDAVAYAADPELDWLHVLGVIDFSGGGFIEATVADIDYTLGDHIDSQRRSFWREPVANQAALPVPGATPNPNRDGDVRVALDTKTLYIWDDGLAMWQPFDEAPSIAHRDDEHANGIIPGSAVTSLEPTIIAGPQIRILAVSGAYTVDGRRYTAPGVDTDINPAALTDQGIIQVWVDNLAAVQSGYRLQYAAAPNITGVIPTDISDNHTVAAGLILQYDSGTTSMAWNGGEPLDISGVSIGERFRVFGPDYTEWLEMEVTGALPGIISSDSMDVLAGAGDVNGNDDEFLIANYGWDGSAALRISDRRFFGNTSDANLRNDAVAFIEDPSRDFRGTTLVNGGLVTDAGGLDIRVGGPLVVYINGTRTEVPAAYSPITLPASTVNYVHVTSAGVIASVAGAFPVDSVPLAIVTTGGAAISTISDERFIYMTAGMGGNARMRWDVNSSLDLVGFQKDGVTDNVRVIALDFAATNIVTGAINVVGETEVASEQGLWTDNAFGGAPPHRFRHDDIGNDIYIHRTAGVDEQVEPHMLGSTTPSIIGALRFAQEARSNVRGSVSPMSVTRIDDSNVEVAAGSFVDGYGRLIEVPSPVTVPIPVDGARCVFWDPNGESFDEGEIGTLLSYMDPFAVVVKAGGIIDPAEIIDCQRHSSNEFNRTYSTIGPLANGPQGSQFETLEAAMLNSSCYAGTGAHENRMPTEFVFVGATSMISATGKGIDFTDPWWGAVGGDRVKGSLTHSRARDTPLVQWNLEGPGFAEMNGNMRFENLSFYYSGPINIANDDVCIFKNPGSGLSVESCTMGIVNTLTHVAVWDDATVRLNDNFGTERPTSFRSCSFRSSLAASADSMFRLDDTTTVTGRLIVEDSDMNSSAAFNYIFSLGSDTPNTKVPSIVLDNTNVNNIAAALFNHVGTSLVDEPPGFDAAPKLVNNCQITTTGTACELNETPFGYAVRMVDVKSTTFLGYIDLNGGRTIESCHSDFEVVVQRENSFINCNFGSGNAHGVISSATDSLFQMAGTESIQLERHSDQHEVGGVNGCSFYKLDPVNNSSQVLFIRDSGVAIVNCFVECEDSSGTPSSDYVITVGEAVTMLGCNIKAPVDGICVGSIGRDSADLIVEGCRMTIKSGGRFYHEITDSVNNSTKIFANNRFHVSATTGEILFEAGGTVASDKVANSIVFDNNKIYAPNSLGSDIIEFNDVDHVSITDNISVIDKNTPISAVHRYVVGPGSGGITPATVVFSGNLARVTQASSGDAYSNVVITATELVADANLLEGHRDGASISWFSFTGTYATASANLLRNTGTGGSAVGITDAAPNVRTTGDNVSV